MIPRNQLFAVLWQHTNRPAQVESLLLFFGDYHFEKPALRCRIIQPRKHMQKFMQNCKYLKNCHILLNPKREIFLLKWIFYLFNLPFTQICLCLYSINIWLSKIAHCSHCKNTHSQSANMYPWICANYTLKLVSKLLSTIVWH